MLGSWLTEIVRAFGDQRLLGIDHHVAVHWGSWRHELERTGALYAPVDAMIAATAMKYGLTVVTRDVRHFEAANVAILNPW